MSVSWYSINITVDSNNVFSGYFSVDNDTNVIQQFYNANAIGTNILYNYSSDNNKFVNGNFTNYATTILSIPALDSTYNATLWGLGTNSKNGPLTYLLYYGTNPTLNNIANSVPGTINFITTLQSGPPLVVPICFPAGTPIATDQGIIHIEKINPAKNTIRGNKIVAITKTVTIEDKIICIEKDALGTNIPSQKTYISRNHKLFYNKQMIKAKHLIGQVDGVYNKKYNREILYNVLLDKHDKMIVNNLIVETLNPENIVAKLYNGNYTDEERNNIIVNINQCANDYKKIYGKLR
jgi:hypothetical protein